jgi:hypothetical protein
MITDVPGHVLLTKSHRAKPDMFGSLSSDSESHAGVLLRQSMHSVFILGPASNCHDR